MEKTQDAFGLSSSEKTVVSEDLDDALTSVIGKLYIHHPGNQCLESTTNEAFAHLRDYRVCDKLAINVINDECLIVLEAVFND